MLSIYRFPQSASVSAAKMSRTASQGAMSRPASGERFVRFGADDESHLDKGAQLPADLLTPGATIRRIETPLFLDEVSKAIDAGTNWKLITVGEGNTTPTTYEAFEFKANGRNYTVRHFQMSDADVHYVKTPQYRVRANDTYEQMIEPAQYEALAQKARVKAQAALQLDFGLKNGLDPLPVVQRFVRQIVTDGINKRLDRDQAGQDPTKIAHDTSDHSSFDSASMTLPTGDGTDPQGGIGLYYSKRGGWNNRPVYYNLSLYRPNARREPAFTVKLSSPRDVKAMELLRQAYGAATRENNFEVFFGRPFSELLKDDDLEEKFRPMLEIMLKKQESERKGILEALNSL